jgi:ABC-type polysaccharide/polyol phosphate transport system ATPase subunit
MTESVIHVEGLGKRYRVGERERYFALRDVLARTFSAPFKKNGAGRSRDYIWALRDVSLDVHQGEVVGLIGRNGAGKTTLLKLLSRITRPTTGFAEIRGRVGSLLEVGTGFHPELTGRENIYLSGAILGMSRREIDRKMDAIVAFAEVERFLGSPLKFFSTGMQMRLAFAVAAHLEPEILLVDEVLAVGDLEFQKKCLGKMQEVSRSGRTIVFVSHQMNQIRRLCERVFWVDGGTIHRQGPTGKVIAAYEAGVMQASQDRNQLNAAGVFLRWELAQGGNILRDGLREVTFRFAVNLREPVRRGHFGFHIYNDSSVLVASWGFDELEFEPGLQNIEITIPYLPLRPESYSIMCSIFTGGNNLNGGHMLEAWNAVPFLAVDSLPLSHKQDGWAGVFNIPAEIKAGDRTHESRA